MTEKQTIPAERIEAGIEALRKTPGTDHDKVIAVYRAMTDAREPMRATNKSKPERPDWDG